MDEAEWLTRRTRIDTRLRSLKPAWRIVPWSNDLAPSKLDRHAVTEFPTANGPADYALWVNGILLGIVEAITKKDRRLTAQHFAEFEKAYGKDPNGLSRRTDTGEAGRFRKFQISEIKERGYKLDITWLKDESLEDSDELPEPQDLAGEAITELEAVVDDLREIVALV